MSNNYRVIIVIKYVYTSVVERDQTFISRYHIKDSLLCSEIWSPTKSSWRFLYSRKTEGYDVNTLLEMQDEDINIITPKRAKALIMLEELKR